MAGPVQSPTGRSGDVIINIYGTSYQSMITNPAYELDALQKSLEEPGGENPDPRLKPLEAISQQAEPIIKALGQKIDEHLKNHINALNSVFTNGTGSKVASVIGPGGRALSITAVFIYALYNPSNYTSAEFYVICGCFIAYFGFEAFSKYFNTKQENLKQTAEQAKKQAEETNNLKTFFTTLKTSSSAIHKIGTTKNRDTLSSLAGKLITYLRLMHPTIPITILPSLGQIQLKSKLPISTESHAVNSSKNEETAGSSSSGRSSKNIEINNSELNEKKYAEIIQIVREDIIPGLLAHFQRFPVNLPSDSNISLSV